MLIRQGAKLVETANDVLEELNPLLAGVYEAGEASGREAHGVGDPGLDPDHLKLLDKMGFDPVSVDQLVERSQLTPAEVSSMLLILELRGFIHALPGGRYVHKG